MRKLLPLFSLLFFGLSNAQIVNIPDAAFKAKLVQSDTDTYTAKDILGNYIRIDANDDGEIQLSEAAEVDYLKVDFSSISSLEGLSSFVNLRTFFCEHNPIPDLTQYLYGLTSLTHLYCGHNDYTSLDLSSLTGLKLVSCGDLAMTSLNVTGLSNLEDLSFRYSPVTSVNLSGLTNLKILECSYCDLNALDVNGLSNLEDLWCDANQLTSLSIDNLPHLWRIVSNDNQLTGLNLSNLPALKYLSLDNNQLSSLSINALTSLERLWCANNLLTSLEISNLNALDLLICNDNNISALELGNLAQLEWLVCGGNELTGLNLNGLNHLTNLRCSDNHISSLDLTALPKLYDLEANNNQLTTIDVRNQENMAYIVCKNNLLHSVFMKNGSKESIVHLEGNPNLEYICADEDEITDLQQLMAQYGNNSNINSYCSFTPGGDFYVIAGKAKNDADSNGCDTFDGPIPLMKFSVTDGTDSGTAISDVTGNYTIPVQAGTHQVTPVMENPSYYNISPVTAMITFPGSANLIEQDFCLSPNGIHPDLEISILPVNNARPGFDAHYKILFKNKGNQTQSGTFYIGFDDSLVDYISSDIPVSLESPSALSWNFNDLAPFETKAVNVIFNLNSPVETPPVNGGDTLQYTAEITSSQTDEMPSDNTFTLNQHVINSLDPNDKTCLEGNAVGPDMVGKYVHYMIRFENTGTADAQNIVVKDMIDTSKFDIASLIPLDGSHPFTTRISNPDKVEFIFENIQLPFDDDHNDGYVAFKIRTLPTLVTGNSFSNSAGIYFDYNAPVVTNIATTAIQVLGTDDIDFNGLFTLFPNPATNILNIRSNGDLQIQSVSVYNTLGQLLVTAVNPAGNIDISALASGSYFIKIISDRGSASSKFIKK